MIERALPVGKLPAPLLEELLSFLSFTDEQVLVGPGPGIDCAVLDLGDCLLVLKSDPVTFVAADIGQYLVQINVNDIVTTGATPRWLMVTLLLPEKKTTAQLARTVFEQLREACRASNITIVGGHTEIAHGLDRPIAVGTLIGVVDRDELITPRGARPGDRLLLTKFVPIEAVAILASEFSHMLERALTREEIEAGQNYLIDPGISVMRDALIARASGRINAMHDPTEGGLAAALWELADACGHAVFVDTDSVPVSTLARRICTEMNIDYMAAISSGALLLSVPEGDHAAIAVELRKQGIPCTVIGYLEPGEPIVWRTSPPGRSVISRPARDEIARLYDEL